MQAQHDPDDLPPTLTDDSQDPQEADWNRFIVRLNNARQQGGEQEAQGTLLGAARFGREGSAGRAKMETLNRLVIGGIPNRLRPGSARRWPVAPPSGDRTSSARRRGGR